MIVQKPTDLDPAMKSALKNHIMRKRQQLKQEMEQDAIGRRLKREQEAKRKQDAMTLDQLKEQLGHLEKTLDNLKNEKHCLFLQLKQNMRVLNEDDKQRKQKEEEINASKLQQNNEQNNKQTNQTHHLSQQQQQHNNPLATQSNNLILNQQPSTSNEQGHVHLPNQENHAPPHKDRSASEANITHPHSFLHHPHQHQPPPPPHQSQSMPPQQQQLPPPPPQQLQQSNHLDQDTLPQNSHPSQQPSAHGQWPNSVYSQSAAISQLINGKGPRKPSAALLAQISQSIPFNHHPMNFYPQLGHNQNPASMMSGPGGVPTSMAHAPQGSPMVRPSPPPPPLQIPNSPVQLNTSAHKMSNIPNTSSGPVNFIPNLSTSSALNNPAAAAAALGLPYAGSPMSMFNSGALEAHLALERHVALNAAAAANQALNSNSSNSNPGNSGGGIGNNPNGSNNSSRNTLLQSMKRPISATNLASESASPNKKLHNQAPQPGQSQSHQIPSSLSNPYLGYPGLPPGLGGPGNVGGPSLQASMFSHQNHLMRTPPPPNMGSLFNTAAFSHLLNAQNFPRQSPYLPQLSQLPQASRPGLPSPFGHHHLSQYPHLGHHPGIPTSLAHASQGSPMIRPSPPPQLHIPNSAGQLNPGGHKMPSLPITSAGPMDFNPNLSTSTAHQMQQQALNNQAVAAAAALGLPGFGPPYFNRYP